MSCYTHKMARVFLAAKSFPSISDEQLLRYRPKAANTIGF